MASAGSSSAVIAIHGPSDLGVDRYTHARQAAPIPYAQSDGYFKTSQAEENLVSKSAAESGICRHAGKHHSKPHVQFELGHGGGRRKVPRNGLLPSIWWHTPLDKWSGAEVHSNGEIASAARALLGCWPRQMRRFQSLWCTLCRERCLLSKHKYFMK